MSQSSHTIFNAAAATPKPRLTTSYGCVPNFARKLLTPFAFLVYEYYLSQAPGWVLNIKDIMNNTNLSKYMVYKALNELDEKNLVTKEPLYGEGRKFDGMKYHRFATQEEGAAWRKKYNRKKTAEEKKREAEREASRMFKEKRARQKKEASRTQKPAETRTATTKTPKPLLVSPDTVKREHSKIDLNPNRDIQTHPAHAAPAERLNVDQAKAKAERVLTEKHGELNEQDRVWIDTKIDELTDKLDRASLSSLVDMVLRDYAKRMVKIYNQAKWSLERTKLHNAQIAKIRREAARLNADTRTTTERQTDASWAAVPGEAQPCFNEENFEYVYG